MQSKRGTRLTHLQGSAQKVLSGGKFGYESVLSENESGALGFDCACTCIEF